MLKVEINSKDLDTWFLSKKKRERVTENFVRDIAAQGEKYVVDQTQKISATGKLESSIATKRIKKYEYDVVGEKYAKYALEYGRGPGKRPPLAPLKAWARARNLPKGIEYHLQKQIAARGTKKYRRRGPKQITRARRNLDKYIDKMTGSFLESLLK